MENPRLAGRYAKCLIDLAVEQNQLEEVFQDVFLFKTICKKNLDFVSMLRSPIIPFSKKATIIEVIAKDKINKLTYAFIQLLVTKNRESYLPEIMNAFISQYNVIKNINPVKLTTAIAVSDAVKNSIIEKVKTIPGMGTVELETVVNKDLIGGFTLETNNTLIDASILRDLKDVKKQFMNNDYVHRIR